MRRRTNAWLCRLLAVTMLLGLLPAFVESAPVEAAGPTTSLTVTKHDAYGNVLSTATVTYSWMAANLTVQGDGQTRYYCQGPTFDRTSFNSVWDPTEDVNVDSRDYGRPEGTDVKDLCNLVGGASPGDTIRIKAADNYNKWFDYQNVYNPDRRQGKMVVCWYNADFGGYVSENYTTGMRLLFFADSSSNPWGWHVFGDWDMHETMPESRWYYYYNSGAYWPSSGGLSVQLVSNIDIYQPNLVSCDASGNAQESFAPGQTVYEKGRGLAASAGYKVWIQPYPVSNNKLSIVSGQDPALLPAYQFSTANDPSGSQEVVTTDSSGGFGPVAIWSIPASAAYQKYHVVADSQSQGTVGTFDSYDYIGFPGWQGFSVAAALGWDLNGDHVCNIGDVVMIGLHWGQTGAHGWISEDLNNDGVINISDVVVIGLHWGQTW